MSEAEEVIIFDDEDQQAYRTKTPSPSVSPKKDQEQNDDNNSIDINDCEMQYDDEEEEEQKPNNNDKDNNNNTNHNELDTDLLDRENQAEENENDSMFDSDIINSQQQLQQQEQEQEQEEKQKVQEEQEQEDQIEQDVNQIIEYEDDKQQNSDAEMIFDEDEEDQQKKDDKNKKESEAEQPVVQRITEGLSDFKQIPRFVFQIKRTQNTLEDKINDINVALKSQQPIIEKFAQSEGFLTIVYLFKKAYSDPQKNEELIEKCISLFNKIEFTNQILDNTRIGNVIKKYRENNDKFSQNIQKKIFQFYMKNKAILDPWIKKFEEHQEKKEKSKNRTSDKDKDREHDKDKKRSRDDKKKSHRSRSRERERQKDKERTRDKDKKEAKDKDKKQSKRSKSKEKPYTSRYDDNKYSRENRNRDRDRDRKKDSRSSRRKGVKFPEKDEDLIDYKIFKKFDEPTADGLTPEQWQHYLEQLQNQEIEQINHSDLMHKYTLMEGDDLKKIKELEKEERHKLEMVQPEIPFEFPFKKTIKSNTLYKGKARDNYKKKIQSVLSCFYPKPSDIPEEPSFYKLENNHPITIKPKDISTNRMAIDDEEIFNVVFEKSIQTDTDKKDKKEDQKIVLSSGKRLRPILKITKQMRDEKKIRDLQQEKLMKEEQKKLSKLFTPENTEILLQWIDQKTKNIETKPPELIIGLIKELNKFANLPQIIKNLKVISALKEQAKRNQKQKDLMEKKREGFDKYMEKNNKKNPRKSDHHSSHRSTANNKRSRSRSKERKKRNNTIVTISPKKQQQQSQQPSPPPPPHQQKPQKPQKAVKYCRFFHSSANNCSNGVTCGFVHDERYRGVNPNPQQQQMQQQQQQQLLPPPNNNNQRQQRQQQQPMIHPSQIKNSKNPKQQQQHDQTPNFLKPIKPNKTDPFDIQSQLKSQKQNIDLLHNELKQNLVNQTQPPPPPPIPQQQPQFLQQPQQQQLQQPFNINPARAQQMSGNIQPPANQLQPPNQFIPHPPQQQQQQQQQIAPIVRMNSGGPPQQMQQQQQQNRFPPQQQQQQQFPPQQQQQLQMPQKQPQQLQQQQFQVQMNSQIRPPPNMQQVPQYQQMPQQQQQIPSIVNFNNNNKGPNLLQQPIQQQNRPFQQQIPQQQQQKNKNKK